MSARTAFRLPRQTVFRPHRTRIGDAHGITSGSAAARFQLDCRPGKECLLHGGSGRDGSQLPADEEAVRRNHRPEPCRTLTGSVRSSRVNARAMVSVFLPVSTEVLLDTLVMSALRRPSASRR